jgi:hypothetical protein
MSSSRFAGLKQQQAPSPPAVAPSAPAAAADVPKPGRAPARIGKKAVVGYFSSDLSRALHQLALDNNVSIQGLLGEAIDDLMRKYGRHPFGER